MSRSWADTLRAYLNSDRTNRNQERRLLQLQIALMWQLNFELRNFWHLELKELQVKLLDTLKLPRHSSLRQLCLQRAEWIRDLDRQGHIDSFGRLQLMQVANACTEAIGGLERIRNTPLPVSYDVFVRLLTWLFGLLLLLYFHEPGSRHQNPISEVLIVLLFLMAERIGAYVEGPFDADGSSFSLPLDSICLTISRDLLDGDADHVQHLNSKDPVRWT